MATKQIITQAFPYSSEYQGMAPDGKTPIYDRAISSATYRMIWNTYFTQGVGNAGSHFSVTANGGLNIKVSTGSCFMDGVTTVSNNEISLLVENPSTAEDRTDRVVIQNNYADRYTYIYVKKGDRTLIRNGEMYEIGLADINVRKNIIELTGADITDLRSDKEICGQMRNKGEYDWEAPLEETNERIDELIPLTVPSGVICMWSGTVATIPTGWALCNGQNNTPNLLNRFIVGAGSSYTPGNTGGADTVVLTEAQLASHRHGVYGSGYPDYGRSQYTSSGSLGDNQLTTSKGNDSPHENRPPYYALAYIMKL